MIAPTGFTGSGNNVVLAGPLAGVASDTIASFTAIREMMATVGQLAIAFGVGHPLAAFQSLLRTYQTLVRAEFALQSTAQHVLKLMHGAPNAEPLD